MICLGISPLDKDATVTLMIDGQIVSAIAEERLSRQKMHSGFPYQALPTVLNMANVKASDIDCVAYAFYDAPTERRLMRRERHADLRLNRRNHEPRISKLIADAQDRLHPRQIDVPGLARGDEAMPKSTWKRRLYELASSDGLIGDLMNHHQLGKWLDTAAADHRQYERELIAGLCEFGLADKLERVEHHQSHAANAFYGSEFDRALIVTIDAYGSGLSATISIGSEHGIERLDALPTPYSLGSFYDSVTSALGFRPDRHAGKIVGLAAYGDAEILGDVLRGLIVWDGHRPRWRRSSDVYLARRLASMFPKVDLAAAYQTVLEEIIQRYVGHYVAETGIQNVVLSGGVCANVKLNQRIHELPGVASIYVHPNMGDGGCGTGAAILKTIERGIPIPPLRSVYLGPEYSSHELHAALSEFGLPFVWRDDIEEEVARLLADNHVVARFDGRMEYGPRALGNRSLLYPATDPKVNQWLNERLHRTEFMPFAPATLAEDAHSCYQRLAGAEKAAQFMTVTFDCTPWMRKNSPAAVHIDGTARPQLVSAESNPGFYKILREYKHLTGLPSVINTSFNMHEEPIVCSPHDAIRSFLAGGIDYLALGEFLVASPELARRERREQATLVA